MREPRSLNHILHAYPQPSINVVAGMDCNEVAKGAEAMDKKAPICDERDETEYAPKQCGSNGSF